MAEFKDEHVIGRVASESNYDPNWPTPTWFDLWAYLDEEDIEEFAIIPLGKVGSDKRDFGSTTAIKTTEDVMNELEALAKELIIQGVFPGKAQNPIDVRAARAIIWLDPEYTGELTRRLCFLMQDPIHITGFAIKKIR